MSARDILAALSVAIVWGLTFIAIKVGVGETSPLMLADLEVGGLVVAGAQTDACIRATLHGALVRGYDVTLVSDAHTTEDLSKWGAPPPGQVIAHTNLYWKYQRAPGRAAGVAPAAEVELG